MEQQQAGVERRQTYANFNRIFQNFVGTSGPHRLQPVRSDNDGLSVVSGASTGTEESETTVGSVAVPLQISHLGTDLDDRLMTGFDAYDTDRFPDYQSRNRPFDVMQRLPTPPSASYGLTNIGAVDDGYEDVEDNEALIYETSFMDDEHELSGDPSIQNEHHREDFILQLGFAVAALGSSIIRDDDVLKSLCDYRLRKLKTRWQTGAVDFQRPKVVYRYEVGHNLDIQGIRWTSNLGLRSEFQNYRLENCRHIITLGSSLNYPSQVQSKHSEQSKFFEFEFSNTQLRPQYIHFQLRHNLGVSAQNNVYYVNGSIIREWNPRLNNDRMFLDLSETHLHSCDLLRPSTLAVSHGLCALGGFSGEYIVARLDPADREQPHLAGIITNTRNGITNHASIVSDRQSGLPQVIWSNNDRKVRQMDVETKTVVRSLELPWAVNCTATSPDGRLRVVVGDSKKTAVVDAEGTDILTSLFGHTDYSFACAWHGWQIATGNQDLTTRVYDARKMSHSLHTLKTYLGAVRSLQFSPDGSYLIAAESADYVHLYKTTDYSQVQDLDFFGDISGVGIDPESHSLYVGNGDANLGGILEWRNMNDGITETLLI